MGRVDIGQAFKFAIEKLKGNPQFYLIGSFIFLLAAAIGGGIGVGLNFIVLLFVLKNDGGMLLRLLVNFVFCLIMPFFACLFSAPFFLAYLKAIKKEADGGKAELGDMAAGFKDYVPAYITNLIAQMLISIGTFLCYLPGILVSPILPLSMYHLSEGEASPVEAVKKSIPAFTSNIPLVGFLLLFLIIGGLGIFLCVIGIIPTMAISLLGCWSLCKQAYAPKAEAAPETPAA